MMSDKRCTLDQDMIFYAHKYTSQFFQSWEPDDAELGYNELLLLLFESLCFRVWNMMVGKN